MKRCVRDGDVPRAFLHAILVIMRKDNVGGVRGIGLLEVIHKLISQIINFCVLHAISFYDEVHGFHKRRGTRTAIGETKFEMQIATCESETICQVFLDLKKVNDSMDRETVLMLLEKYRMGPNLLACIRKV